MKTLLAATSLAITLATGAVTAQAQGPMPPPPGFVFDGPGYPGFRRHPGPPPRQPVYRPQVRRHVLPPEPPCPPRVYYSSRVFDILRFVYRR